MSEWTPCKWGELATLEYGKAFRDYDGPGQYPVFGTNGPIGFAEQFLADGPGVVVGRKGAYRGIHYSRHPFFVIDTAFYVKPKTTFDMRWAYYQMLTLDINGMDSGSAIPSTSRDAFYALPVLVPPLEEQRAIASVLGSLDDKIELNRRMNRTLEQMAAAIFKAWFVDFEPVRAKASGAASFPGMAQPVFDALPATFADSELGPIPEGWEVKTVSDFAKLSKDPVKPQEHAEENFDHFSIPAFDSGQMPSVDSGESIKSSKFSVVSGCILVSKLNPRIPRVWLPPAQTERRQIASTEFLVIVPNDDWARAYLWCQFRQPVFADDMAQRASGTSGSHQRVKPGDFMSMAVVQPTSEVVEAFATLVVPKLRLIESNRSESRTLAKTRDALLPKLLSGEVRVGMVAEGVA